MTTKMWHIEKVVLDKEGHSKLTAMEMTGFEPFGVSAVANEFPVIYFKKERPEDLMFKGKKVVETIAQNGVPVLTKTTIETAVQPEVTAPVAIKAEEPTAAERAAMVKKAIDEASGVAVDVAVVEPKAAGKKPKKAKKTKANSTSEGTPVVPTPPDDGSIADIEALIAAGKAAV